jgi:hypothetical protein
MEQKTNKTKIIGRMCKNIGKDLSSLVQTGVSCALGFGALVGTGAAYIASAPVIGSLNHSTNERIHTGLVRSEGEKDEFVASMGGRELAGIANTASLFVMPMLYSFLGYELGGRFNSGGFIGMTGLGVLESVCRMGMTNISKDKYYPGTVIGSTLGYLGEKTFDYLRNKYLQASEMEAKK